MVKESKKVRVPKLRFPEFRDGGAWRERELGGEGEFLSSLTGKSAQHFGLGSAQYITYMNVFSNTFVNIASLGAVDVGKDESQNAVQVGDVLFTVSSETPEEVGMSSVVLKDIPDCYVNSFCAMFRFAEAKRPNLHFLGYLLRQPFVRKYFAKKAQGSTRFNLSKGTFRSLPIAIPSPDEQQKIADCLFSLDDLIAAQGRKVEALKTYKRGLMQQIFPREGETLPRLRFPEFRDAPEWKSEQLDALAKRGSGHTPNKSIAGHYNGGVKWISLADSKRLDKGLISETRIEISQQGLDNSSAVLHPAGSVVLSRDAGVGKSAVMGMPMAVSQHFIVWTCHEKRISNWFLYYVLQKMKPIFESIATGSTIKTIGVPFFRDMTVMLPALPEQQTIAELLFALDNRVTAESEKLADLKTHKIGLMQQLFPSLEDK